MGYWAYIGDSRRWLEKAERVGSHALKLAFRTKLRSTIERRKLNLFCSSSRHPPISEHGRFWGLGRCLGGSRKSLNSMIPASRRVAAWISETEAWNTESLLAEGARSHWDASYSGPSVLIHGVHEAQSTCWVL